MRKSYILLILCTLAIAIALLLAACSKTGPKGATGPAGPQGSAGLQGTAGAQGAPGPAGSQIFETDGVPAPTLGNVGDFDINEQTDSLYGPKTLAGWGNAISLQGTAGAPGTPGTPGAPGSAGAAGAAGSQILSGSTPPTPTTGAPEDYYFDNVTDSLYGPKTSSGWGTAVSLRGSAGATGSAGQTGAQGPPGTANVIYYNWTSFNVPTWGNFDPTYFRREYSISMPSITSQLLDQGVVLVYLENVTVSNGDTTEQLIDQVPDIFYNFYAPTGAQKENLIAELSPGVLNFYLSDAMDNNDPGELFIVILPTKPPVTTGYLYRIILIPGGIAGTSIDPHQLTYKEVCTKYGIQP